MSELGSLNPDLKNRLQKFMDNGLAEMQEIEDRRGGLKDLTKKVADELAIKPAELTKALQVAHKNKLLEAKAKHDTVVDILEITGHG